MALKTLVKVGEINNLSDARFCAGMGVDLAGFNLDEKSSVSPELFIAITGWVEGIQLVGEFETSSVDKIEQLHEQFKFDYIQVSSIEILNKLKVSCPKILKIKIDQSIDDALSIAQQNDSMVAYFLLESENQETISKSETSKITSFCKQYSVLLGYGINSTDVEDTILNINPAGISLKGGDEIRPGYKDFDELGDILEALEID